MTVLDPKYFTITCNSGSQPTGLLFATAYSCGVSSKDHPPVSLTMYVQHKPTVYNIIINIVFMVH